MRINARKLGANLKKLRQGRGFSQEDLSHAANMKLSNLAKLEGGFNINPTLATLIALANVLTDGSLDELLK